MAFPDVTALLIAHLDPIVAPVPVAADVPSTLPARLVQVRRIGGAANPPVRDQPRIDLIAWAPSAAQAMGLLLTVRTELWTLPGTDTIGVNVYRLVEEGGPRQINDPETGTPMAWMTAQLDVRADNAIMFTN